jgi:hypothetical protein
MFPANISHKQARQGMPAFLLKDSTIPSLLKLPHKIIVGRNFL